jgi:hypothetical protein
LKTKINDMNGRKQKYEIELKGRKKNGEHIHFEQRNLI